MAEILCTRSLSRRPLAFTSRRDFGGNVGVVASKLECVGLATDSPTEFRAFVDELWARAVPIGSTSAVHVRRFQDPSGARMVISRNAGGELVDLIASYAGQPGVLFGAVAALNYRVAIASVVDQTGEQLTSMACELEQRHLLPGRQTPVSGAASVVAFGVDVSVHADIDAFAISDASLLGPPGQDSTKAPTHFVKNGWPWPPRVAPESFISDGVFAAPGAADADAKMAGTVLRAEKHRTEATGQSFVVARLRTAGFEVDICMPATENDEPPVVGQVIAGTVSLVASIDSAFRAPSFLSRLRHRR
jgi:hypothetical protein